MRDEFWWFLVGLPVVYFLKFGTGSLSGFKMPTLEWAKWASLAPDKDFSSRSLWACIVVGAIGFHWYHTIYPLFTCMIIRSFFLPTTTFSVAARWAYIFMMIVFYYLPGIETYSVVKVEDLKAETEQLGKDAKNHKPATEATPQQSQSSPAKRLTLTHEWSEAVYPPMAGGDMKFYCTEKGSWMKIVYDSAQNPIAASGEPFPCSLPGVKAHTGSKFANPRFYFQSDNGGYAFIVNGM